MWLKMTIVKAVIVPLCAVVMIFGASCGGGGEVIDRDLAPPSGDGLLLAGAWTLNLNLGSSSVSNLVLGADGSFTNSGSNFSATGLWTSTDGTNVIIIYSLTNELPPQGTIMTGTVNAARTSMGGEISSSPIPPGYGTWDAFR